MLLLETFRTGIPYKLPRNRRNQGLSMADYQDTVEWTANGAFGIPATDLASVIEWTAKGSHSTPAVDLTEVIEWTAKGSYVPTYAQIIVEIDLN